jgi:hypothetical protein
MAKKVTKRSRPSGRRKNAREQLPKPATKVARRKGVVPKRPKPKRILPPRVPRPAPREVGVLDLASEAYSEIEELAQEMRDWSDNIETNFGGTTKYEEVSAAADELENIEEPSVNLTAINDHKIMFQDPTPRRRPKSRATRAGDIASKLIAVEDGLRDYIEKTPEADPARDEAEGLADEIENDRNDLENVSFPGMF